MFDGLKDKLDSFRSDVEEEAAEAEAETETETEVGADPDPDPDVDTDPDVDPGAEPSGEHGSDEPPVATDPDPGADNDDSTGRFRRAKAFATGKVVLEAADLEDPLWNLEMALLESDVEMGVAEAILDDLRSNLIGETKSQMASTGDLVEDALADALLSVISVGQFDFEEHIADAEKPVTIVFTGVNGVGKTTTIAKMARYFDERGYSSVLANGDTYRAGANEQIREHAEALDKRLIAHEQGGDPAAVVYDGVEYAEANGVDVVLGDTAGRLHTSSDLMAQLEKIDRVVDPDLTLFVDEAVAGQDAVERAQQFDDAAEIDGAVLTKADADSQGGAAISVAYVTGKPVLFLGTGQGYDDLDPFDPEELVDDLLGS
jgi:fused signal recognition particle receptor